MTAVPPRGPLRYRPILVSLGVAAALQAYFLAARPSLAVDGAVLLLFTGAVVLLLRQRGESFRSVGITLGPVNRKALGYLIPGAAVMIAGAIGLRLAFPPLDPPPLFPGILLGLLLYPLWGFLQQLFYLGFVERGLERSGIPARLAAVLAGVAYGVVHAPNWPLVAATTPMGVYLALVYLRAPALLPIAFVHGLGGALAIFVIGLDLAIGSAYGAGG